MTPSGRAELVPDFPRTSFTPDSPCPHKGPYPVGSVLCCMRCHKSGMDGADVMQIDPRDLPKPEPKAPAVEVDPTPETTRAEKTGRKTSGKMHRRKARKRSEAA